MSSVQRTVYLDHAATTPLDQRVFEVMVPFLKEQYGNASSVHRLGRKARFAVEDARERISAHLNASPGEIVFTSGGTEANNMALKGRGQPGRFITSKAEHEAILKQQKGMEKLGWVVDIVTPEQDGSFSLKLLEEAVDDETRLVSCMHVNNEVGIVNPISNMGEMLREKGIVFHCDAVQSIGHHAWDPEVYQVDLLTGSAHKFYGPKGAGFLYVRGGRGIRWTDRRRISRTQTKRGDGECSSDCWDGQGNGSGCF